MPDDSGGDGASSCSSIWPAWVDNCSAPRPSQLLVTHGAALITANNSVYGEVPAPSPFCEGAGTTSRLIIMVQCSVKVVHADAIWALYVWTVS